MKKCIALLTIALLFNAVVSRAEEKTYYTFNEDKYYHTNIDCDRPMEKNWWGGAMQDFYERKAYQKYEISEKSAIAFEKKACPVCVKELEPVYLGDHMPEWNYEVAPWEINGLTEEQEVAFRESRPAAFQQEIAATAEAFNAYYEEIYNDQTNQIERLHDYPAFFAGKYSSNAGCLAYQIVDFNDEMLAAFRDMFGGGAWIVPAKYGYDEIYATRERIFQELMSWCAAHPELDARVVSAVGPGYENYAVIGISGVDWKQAAAAFEESAPVYIHFAYDEISLACDAF